MASLKIKSKRLKISDMRPGALFLIASRWKVFWIQEDIIIVFDVMNDKLRIESGGNNVVDNFNTSLRKDEHWKLIK